MTANFKKNTNNLIYTTKLQDLEVSMDILCNGAVQANTISLRQPNFSAKYFSYNSSKKIVRYKYVMQVSHFVCWLMQLSISVELPIQGCYVQNYIVPEGLRLQ